MITSTSLAGRCDDDESFLPMWLFLLEAGTALALFLFILWWTLPKKEKDSADDTGATQSGNKEADREQP
jgi:hypothetical protein